MKQLTYELNDTVESVDEDIDDETMDPDWVKTPLIKARRKTTVRFFSYFPFK